MRETWYVLEDGNPADPADVAPDDSGALRHKDGVAVAMKGQVPHTSGVDPEEERAKAKPAPAAEPPKATRDMAPEPEPQAPKKLGYKTRGKGR